MRIVTLAALALGLSALSPARADAPQWSGWSDEVFARSAKEKRFVILDLEAVWCHWCHVMEEKTYSDPKIQALLGAKYIPVRVDQDANPDLSSRYGDWGWPATIIFGPDGKELVKLRGYIPPERLRILLQAVIDDPTPGPSVFERLVIAPAASPFLPPKLKMDLRKRFDASYDSEHGGWGDVLRYIDADSFDLDMSLAETGDKKAEAEARKTLDAALALIDPVWGGVYQYSDKTDWSSPHFEKIMSFQTQYLRQYSQAYARWRDPRYLAAAKQIKDYLLAFLRSPDGAFYVSQDADLSREVDGHVYYALDDAGRRKLGFPRIDKNLYARENGWAISALSQYYNVSDDRDAIAAAETAARWVGQNRSLPGGGFRHAEKDRGGPFLSDTLAMGQAFLDLYAATGNREWLAKAGNAGDFITANFRDPAGGFVPSKTGEAAVGVLKAPLHQLDDQMQVARTLNLLARYLGRPADKDSAAHAMRYAVGAAVAAGNNMRRPLPGLLLADLELSREPTHITIVGHKDDVAAQKLHEAGMAYPALYKRLDWWDTRDGPLVNPDITYPELDRAAAFACGDRLCSLPAFTDEELKANIEGMARVRTRKAQK